jgi:hypothetical protein
MRAGLVLSVSCLMVLVRPAFAQDMSTDPAAPEMESVHNPYLGMERDGLIPKIDKSAYVARPERWRYVPGGGILQEERSFVRAGGGYRKTLTRRFFGIGPATDEGDETSYTDEVAFFDIGLSRSLEGELDNLVVDLGLIVEGHRLDDGHVGGDPNTEDVFPTWPLFHDGGTDDEEHPPTDSIGFHFENRLSSGDLPFFARPSLGGSRILRGFIEGRWRECTCDDRTRSALSRGFRVLEGRIQLFGGLRAFVLMLRRSRC